MSDRVHVRRARRTVLRVVILSTLVGRRTGPLTRSCLSLARLMRSFETGIDNEKLDDGGNETRYAHTFPGS